MQEPQNHTPNDEDIALARSGDRRAFERIMDSYLPMSYRMAYRLLGSSDEAQDICQDAFVRVWKHLPSFDQSRPFTAWLSTIVTRLAFDRLRGRRRTSGWLMDGERGRQVIEGASDPDGGIARRVEWSDLSAAVICLAGRLPPTQRIVFALRDLEDLDVDEVANVTGLSRSSVKANLSYARRRLRELLIREYQVEGLQQ